MNVNPFHVNGSQGPFVLTELFEFKICYVINDGPWPLRSTVVILRDDVVTQYITFQRPKKLGFGMRFFEKKACVRTFIFLLEADMERVKIFSSPISQQSED